MITPGGTTITVEDTPDGKNTILVLDYVYAKPVHLLLSPNNVRELIIELEKHEFF